MFGPKIDRFDSVRDATVLEMVPVAVLIVAILAVGIYPSLISDVFTLGVQPIVDALQGAELAMVPRYDP